MVPEAANVDAASPMARAADNSNDKGETIIANPRSANSDGVSNGVRPFSTMLATSVRDRGQRAQAQRAGSQQAVAARPGQRRRSPRPRRC